MQDKLAHTDPAERMMALFIEEAGLSELAMKSVRMTIENGDLNALWIDAFDRKDGHCISVTQYDDSVKLQKPISALITFSISNTGLLQLERTKFKSLISSEIAEGRDQQVAARFARRLLRGKYAEAVRSQLETSGPRSGRKVEMAPLLGQANQPNLDTKHNQQSNEPAVEAVQPAQEAEQRSLNLEVIPPATSTQFERLQKTGQVLGSVVVQRALEQRDPQLHTVLGNKEATASVEVEQLQNWYADVSAQRAAEHSDQHETVVEEQQLLDLEVRQPIPITQTDTRVKQISIPAVPALASIHAEKQPQAGWKLASSVIQQAVKQRDPQLHAVLADKETTVPVEVGQLRDWYAAVQAQQSSKLSEHLKAIAEKGKQAKELGKTHLTISEAGRMTADINRFSKSQPQTTVGDLRTWYRANAAISEGSHTQNIQKIALNMKETGKNRYQLRPADYVRMEKEVKAFQVQIARDIEPSLRSIWKLAVTNELVTQEHSGKLAFIGVNYSITSTQDETLTLTHKQTSSEMSLTKSGKVIKNELTLDDAKMLRTISEKLTAASEPKRIVSMQV